MSTKDSCVGIGRAVIDVGKRISRLDDEEDVLLRNDVQLSVIKVCDVESISCGSVLV